MGMSPALAFMRFTYKRKSHRRENAQMFNCPALSSHIVSINPWHSRQPTGQLFFHRRSTALPAVPPCPASLPATPARLDLPYRMQSCSCGM